MECKECRGIFLSKKYSGLFHSILSLNLDKVYRKGSRKNSNRKLRVGLPAILSWNVDQRLNFSFDCRSRSCLATQIQLGNAECSFSHESKPHHFICIQEFQIPTYQHITITGQNLGKWLTWNICMGFWVWCMGYVVLSIQIHQYRSQNPPFKGIWHVDEWVGGCWEDGATIGSKFNWTNLKKT